MLESQDYAQPTGFQEVGSFLQQAHAYKFGQAFALSSLNGFVAKDGEARTKQNSRRTRMGCSYSKHMSLRLQKTRHLTYMFYRFTATKITTNKISSISQEVCLTAITKLKSHHFTILGDRIN